MVIGVAKVRHRAGANAANEKTLPPLSGILLPGKRSSGVSLRVYSYFHAVGGKMRSSWGVPSDHRRATTAARRVLGRSIFLARGAAWHWRRSIRPAWFGTLRRLEPLSPRFGYDRGTPIDRHYIEHFLAEQRRDIRGAVLEVKDSTYTTRFGVGVTLREVVDIDPRNRHATIIADLARADQIPAARFDCFILTQTLPFIFDTRAVLRHARRVLKPGGVLLVTVPTTCRIDAAAGAGDYWRFTPDSCRVLFEDVFGAENVRIRAFGNVLSSIAFLMGISYQELRPRELAFHDPQFPLVVAVRAVKPA